MNAARPGGLELSVVMPVYNEAEAIASVVRSWLEELTRLQIKFELLAYDDGSRDGTLEVLERVARDDPRMVVRSHPNMGHGPTILKGYSEAAGEWVFQADSDNEMTPSSFEPLWTCRKEYDLLLGCRQDRHAGLGRRAISSGSRALVSVLFGSGLRDVNTPYRLIRTSVLAAMLPKIPPGTFAPNVIMAGLAVRERLRVHQLWVPHQPRHAGTSSIAGWRQWRVAFRCAIETVSVARGTRSRALRAFLSRHGTD